MNDKKITEKELLIRLDSLKTNADLFELLECEPPEEWVKPHPKLPNYKYLPIDKVEFLLRKIFKFNYKIEILSTSEIFNAANVNVRVHFRELDSPYNWFSHDGTGADEPMKNEFMEKLKLVENDFELSEVYRIDRHFTLLPYAVAASIPSAKSAAIKDACDHLGKLFGSDLNRKTDNAKVYKQKTVAEKPNKLQNIMIMFETAELDYNESIHIQWVIDNKVEMEYDKVIKRLETLKQQ